MIAQLQGILEAKEPSEIVVDVGGVGYEVQVPLSTYYRLPEPGQAVRLRTHTHVREDAIQIYGFLTAEERELFRLLIGVSKVGPRLALALLSGLDAASLAQAIRARDALRLASVPGVGRKTAERICMELQEKVPDEAAAAACASGPAALLERCPYKEVVAALLHLGYRRNEIREVVQGIAVEDERRSVEELVRESLRQLARA